MIRLGLFVPTPRRSYDRVESALWIRALQMVSVLRQNGATVSLNNPFRRYDAVIYHRGMRRNSVRFVRYLKRISRRVYWDTCVDYFQPHEAASPLQVECAREIVRIADGVCVPTEGIAASARLHASNVFVMPDPVDLEHFADAKADIDLDRPVLGWSGVACKAKFLEPYASFLDGRTVIVSEAPPRLPFRYDFVRWSHAAFPEMLKRADVAFLPRTLESTYTVNNSSFKALVYAVLGIPILASRLPSYELLAQDFKAISFLEDHGSDPQKALEAVASLDRSTRDVRAAYDRRFQAARLLQWLGSGQR